MEVHGSHSSSFYQNRKLKIIKQSNKLVPHWTPPSVSPIFLMGSNWKQQSFYTKAFPWPSSCFSSSSTNTNNNKFNEAEQITTQFRVHKDSNSIPSNTNRPLKEKKGCGSLLSVSVNNNKNTRKIVQRISQLDVHKTPKRTLLALDHEAKYFLWPFADWVYSSRANSSTPS